MRKLSFMAVIGLAVLSMTVPVFSADMFLKIDGIPGESHDQVHYGEIDVLSWSWGVMNDARVVPGKGGSAGAGKPASGSITITKWVDSSTPIIMQNCCNGKTYSKAKLTVRKTDGSMIEYVSVEMRNLIISSVMINGPAPNEDRLTENVTLNYTEVKTEYQPQDDGGSNGGTIDLEWDIEGNKKE